MKPNNPIPFINRLNLEKLYGGYETPEFVNSIPLTPYQPIPNPVPGTVGMNVNLSGAGETMGLDQLRSMTSPQSKFEPSKLRGLDELTDSTGRYDQFTPNYDNEDAYAQQQGWTTKAFNGLTKGSVLAATTFVQTTAGLLNGLYQASSDGRAASFYDNEFNRTLDGINVALEDKLATYETNKFKNADWHSPDYLFTGNFIWEGVVKNLGFAAGAAGSGFAFGAALKGLGGLARLTAVGKAEAAIVATEEALALGEGVSGITGRVGALSKEFGGYNNILNKGYRATVAGLATTGEAGIEAFHNLNEYRDTAIELYKKENGGRGPEGADLAKINEAADEVGNATFKGNMGILTLTNYIQFPTILGKSFKTDKLIANSRAVKINPITRVDGKLISPTASKLKRLGRAIKNPYVFSWVESFEEGGQFAIAEGAKDFYDKKYGENEDDNTWFDSLLHGVKKTIGTNEGMKNVLIGGLSGAIMLGPGRVSQSIQKTADTGNALRDFKMRDLSDFISDSYDSVLRGKVLENEWTDAVVGGDVFGAQEKAADYIINYLIPRIKYGRYDLVMQDIKDIEQLASTEEGWAQLIAEGKVKEGDTKEEFTERLVNLKEQAESVANTFNALNLKYSGRLNEDGSKQFPKEVMDKLLFAAGKIAHYNNAIPKLESEIGVVIDEIKDDKALEEAQLELLENNDFTDDQIEDQIEKLNRAVKMNLAKKRMLQEYAAIKFAPELYTEKTKDLKETALADDGVADDGNILIKTKNHPDGVNYKVGKKYVLGNAYDVDKKGNKVFRFPTLTFLGENVDGTIKIQDSKGQVRDVSKAMFEDYNLGSEEAIEKSPDARFYRRNANKIVLWNRGTKKGGKVKGRIKWDNKSDNLVFVFNENGKTREKVINVDSFKPQEKWYKQGVFQFEGTELSAEDNNDINASEKTGRTAAKVAARVAQRASILTDLYVEVSEKHEATEKLIENKKKDITTIQEKLKALHSELATAEPKKNIKKYIKFKKAANEAMANALKLTRMIRDLEFEVEALEEQNTITIETLAHIEQLTDSLDLYSDDTGDFLTELKFEQLVIEELSEQTVKQISAIKDLLTVAKKALDNAYNFLAGLVKTFQGRFPDVPSLGVEDFIAYLKENRGKLLVENVEDPFNYKEARTQLDELKENILYLESEDIPIAQDRVAKLQEHLDIMEEGMTQLETQSRAMEAVINKFQGIYDGYMVKKAEKEAMIENEILHNEIIGTLDKSEPSKPGNDGYEADAKKPTSSVAASTTVSTTFDEEHVLRANRFAFRFKKFINRGKIKAIIVTKKTEGLLIPGLLAHIKAEAAKKSIPVDEDKGIFAVFVQVNNDGSYDLVGENGTVLTEAEKKDGVNNAIYQPWPLGKLTAKYPKADGTFEIRSMFRDGTKTADIKSITEKYAKWREEQLGSDELTDPVSMNPSFGQPIYEEDNSDSRVNVFDSQLITEEELESSQVLQVVTTNDTVHNNGVTYKTPRGRVFLNILEGLVPMNSSKIGSKKAETIYKVLEQFSKEVSEAGKLTDDSKLLIKWLRSTVQWGTPQTVEDKDGNVIDSKPGYSSVWFDIATIKQDNGVVVTEPRLYVSGLGYSMSFVTSEIIANKSKLIQILSELNHNVNNRLTDVRNYDAEYAEIIDLDKNGEPVYKIWQNYQTYLLSPEGRKTSDIPLTSPYKAIVEEEDVNRHGIYFTLDDSEEMYSSAPEVEEAVPVEEIKKPATPNGVLQVTTIPVFDNKTNNIFVFKNGTTYARYRVNEVGEITTLETFNDEDMKAGLMAQFGPEQGPIAIADMPNKLKAKIKQDITDPALALQNEPPLTPEPDGTLFPGGIDPLAGGTANRDDEIYRVYTDPYETEENWSNVEKWMKKNFSHIPFFRVKNLITATKGRKALGMFHQGAIYVYENAEVGTAYHEVFEAVWNMFASPSERKAIAEEFRGRKGSFIDRESGRSIQYAEASSLELKEELAEEFRSYRLKKDKPKTIIGKFFQDLIDYVKAFLNASANNPSKITEMFDTIDKGEFNNYNRYSKVFEKLSGAPNISEGFQYLDDIEGDETSQFRIDDRIGVPTRELNDVMQHMTYATIANLFKEDSSLLDDNSYTKAELYTTLKANILKLFQNEVATIDSEILKANTARNLNKSRSLAQKKQEKYQLWAQIDANWKAIMNRHVDNLQTYSIVFDENDNVLLNDENNTGRGDYLDSRKIDPFKKASAAVKLMMATIPELDGKTGRPRRSSIGGFVMLDIGESFMQLMAELETSQHPDDMMIRLNKLSSYYPSYKNLYKRLTKEAYTPIDNPNDAVNPPSYEGMTEAGYELLSSFWKTMKKQKPDVITVFQLENGETVVTDSSLTSAGRKAQYGLRNSIINAIKKTRANNLFYYNKSDNSYTAVKQKNGGFNRVELDPANVASYTNFLNDLGMDFTPGDISLLTNNQRKTFFKRTEGLKNELMKIEGVKTLNKNTMNIEGDLFSLGILKATISNEEFQSTYFNVNGEMAQTFIGPNALSNLHHTITNVKSKKELANTIYSYLLTDKFSANSLIMQRLFTSTPGQTKIGNMEDIMKPILVDGTVNEMKNKKTESSKLKYVQRIIQEMNSNLSGIYMNLVPGDAAIEWGLKMHSEERPFVTEEMYDSKSFLKIFKNYLVDEINLVRDARPTVIAANSHKLRFFSAILPAKLQTEVLAKKSKAEKIVFSKGLESKIDAAILDYLKKDAKDVTTLLDEYNLVVRDGDVVTVPTINFNKGAEMTKKSFNKKMAVLSANYMIANIELHKLVYSDPYHYSDELKRIKSFSSPRQALMHDSPTVNKALNRIYNKGFKKFSAGWSNFTRDHLRGVTLADIWSVNKGLSKHSKELVTYLKAAEETDGGGLTTIKANRKIRLKGGMWNGRLEKQYRYDIAYEDFFEGRELTSEQLEIFDPENPDSMNPGEQELYTPIKPIVSGRKANGRDYNDLVLDKFALFVLSYRTLHKMSADSNMLALYVKMQEEDVDYGVFKSGRKVGSETQWVAYDGTTGKLSKEPFETEEQKKNPDLPQTVLNVPFSIISIQTDVPTKTSPGTTQGSQITKLSTLDFMEAGVPIDYVVQDDKGNVIEDISDRYNAWLTLTENAESLDEAEEMRAKASPLYTEVLHNRRLLDAKTDIGYRKLVAKLGITEDANGNLSITKRDRMAATLREEIFSRDVNENISDSFYGFLRGEVILEGTPLYKQIRGILTAFARKNIVRPKINGGFKVQMMETFFEDNRVEKTKDSKGNDVYASGDLKFYVDEDGQRVCEIMVARWFDSPLSDTELLEYLNTTEEGKKLLEGIGYRIPTQKQNSIDAFRVGKFLPKEMKDTVVVPINLVRKVGSDFDIDKLSVYLKNAIGGRRPKAVEYLTEDNSTVEQRYFNWVKDIAGKDTKEYFRFLSKDEVASLREKYNKDKDATQQEFKSEKEETKALSKNAFKVLFANKKEWTTSQDLEMKTLFAEGADYFWSLSEQSLASFEALRTEMQDKDLHGRVEIENYLGLATVLANNFDTSSKDKLALSQMIRLYKQELKVMGYHDAEITKIQEAIDKVKEAKSSDMEGSIQAIIAVTQALNEEFQEGMDEINLNWAKEVASVEGLESLEDFSKLSLYNQNASKELDNAYIDSLFKLTTHPANFARLLIPNSAEEGKVLSREIGELLGNEKIDYGRPSNMLSRRFMSGLRHAFISGKSAIGISAVGQTNHAQNQRSLIYLDEEKLSNLSYTDALYLTDTKINFKHHNQINGKVSLSGIHSAGSKKGSPRFISDIIGMFIDGYVDISAGPWIMELGATSNVAGLWLFLLKTGVPIRDVAFFMNQPIIREYIKNLDSAGLSTLFSRPNIEITRDAFQTKSKSKLTEIPSASVLKEMIGKTGLKSDQNAQQQYIFTEFLKYAKMSEHLLTYVQGSNFDTANFNDPLLIAKKEKQLQRARRSIISSVDENLQSSFVGNVFDKTKKARNGFSDLLISDKQGEVAGDIGPREVVEAILDPYISPYINDKKFVKMGRKVIENLFDWAMQTGSSLNYEIERIFFGTSTKKSVVEQMMDLKKVVMSNANHELFDNIVIKNLELEASGREDQLDNLTIKAKSNKTFNQNLIINAFREIRVFLENQGSTLYADFMKLAVLQSGLTNSHLAFTSLIPYEDFKNQYNSYLTMLGDNPNLSDFLELNEFQRTNPNDSDIVPELKPKEGLVPDWSDPTGTKMKKWNTATSFVNAKLKTAMAEGVIPKVINMSTWDYASENDVVSFSWEKVPMSATDISRGVPEYKVRRRMIKKGDWSFRKKGLFQKVYTYDANGVRTPLLQTQEVKKKGEVTVYTNYVYKMINTRGFGVKAQEHHDKITDSYSGELLGKRSVIDNGFENVDEVSDKRIVEIFNRVEPKTKSIKKGPGSKARQQLVQFPASDYGVTGNAYVKEIKSMKAKYFVKTGRLELDTRIFDKGYVEGKEFSKKLISLGYTDTQVGALLKLIC